MHRERRTNLWRRRGGSYEREEKSTSPKVATGKDDRKVLVVGGHIATLARKDFRPRRRRPTSTVCAWNTRAGNATTVIIGLVALSALGAVSAQQVGSLTDEGLGYELGSSLTSDNPFDETASNPASAIAVSADGTNVYVGGEQGGLVHLVRDAEQGILEVTRTWAATEFDEALQTVEEIVISPDGNMLVTLGATGSSTGTFGVFSIGSDGDLELLQEDDHRGIIRAEFPRTSSKDLYAIDDDQNTLTHLTFDSGRFQVTQTVGGFSCMYGLGVPPDGLNVYVTDDCLYITTNFKRDTDTGSLTFHDELTGSPLNGDGLGCLKSLTFSDSGVWVVGLDSCDDGVSVIQRDLETGTLTPTALVSPINPSGNHLNIDKTWNALVVSDGSGDIYVADWADQYILWIRADFGVGGDGSVIDMSWIPLTFKPSTLAISPTLDTMYAANKEDAAWEGAVLSRVAVQGPEDDSGSGGSGVNSTLAVSLSLSMLALVVVAGLVIKLVIRQRSIDQYAGDEEALKAALEANPNDAVAHNNLGYLMETVHKNYKEAEAHYKEALRINPRAAFAHNSLGHLLHHRHKNFEVAEEHYRKAISLHWRSPDPHYNLGCLLQHQKNDLGEAERQYRHAIKCDPAHGMAQYNLGWVLEKVKGDFSGAEKCYRAAIEADPGDKDASRRLAKVVAQMNSEKKTEEA